MSTSSERHRNNVRAGIFVTLTIALAFVVIATLRDMWSTWLHPTQSYVVTFPVSSGVQALGPGSTVRVGGLIMGSVSSVEVKAQWEDRMGVARAERDYQTILVEFKLDSDVPLFSNARAYVNSGLLGPEAWIEITSIGNAAVHEDGNTSTIIVADLTTDSSNWLVGSTSSGFLETVLGAENAGRTTSIITNIDTFTSSLPDVSREYDEQIVPMLSEAREAIERFNSIMAQADRTWPRWAHLVEMTLLNANAASEKLDLVMDDGALFMSDARSGVADVRNLVEYNRPNVNAFVENLRGASEDVQEVARRVSESTIDKVEMLLDRGYDGVDAFSRTAARIELEFDALAPGLQNTMANLNISATEMKLAVTELRSSPWRLLYRPGRDELENENLFFAATKFSLAAAELRMASEMIDRAITNHKAYLNDNPVLLEQLQAKLSSSVEHYTQAQDELMAILLDEQKP